MSTVQAAGETGDTRCEVVSGGQAHVMEMHGQGEEGADASMELGVLDSSRIGLARCGPFKSTVEGGARGVLQDVDSSLQALHRASVLRDVHIEAGLQDGKSMYLLGGGES